MSEIFHNNDLRVAMGFAARERFENNFDVSLMVDQYRRLINKVRAVKCV